MSQQTFVVLDSIRSAYNVGAIFRTADAAGAEAVWLVGYTPAPIDRFGRPQTEIKKTSLGASDTVPWLQLDVATVQAKLSDAKVAGYHIVAVEQTAQAESLLTWQRPEKVIYILGNEVEGVCEELLSCADLHIQIPMRGSKESLNVSVTAGIVLYH